MAPDTKSEDRRDDPPRSYGSLRERAVELLRQKPDGLDDATLAGQLFGAGDGLRWAALLPGILGVEPQLVHSDGRWGLRQDVRSEAATGLSASRSWPVLPARSAAVHADQGRIVALALATTGADPRRHRIVGIGAVMRERGEVIARLDLVVGVEQRLARAVRRTARAGDADLDAAPAFAEIMPSLRETLEGQTIHAYGARRAQAFVEAELRRADLPALTANFVEVDALLRTLLPVIRKPGIAAAAAELGIPAPTQVTPFAEADIVARVLERLHERQAASPSRAMVDIHADAENHSSAPSPLTPSRPLPFTRSWLHDVPNGPGVYVVLDAGGRTLYVGKALDLYRRLSAYVAKQPSQHRQFEALAVRAASVETISTRSDLEATLLESRLIRQRQPEFNVARQTRAPTTIVRAAPDEQPPGVRLVCTALTDGARYFGPFESVSVARAALAAARSAYPETFERRTANVDDRRRAVLEICRLLSGQKAPTLSLLRESMRLAAERGDRPEVDRLRAALKTIQDLVVQPSPLVGLVPGWRLLVLERPTAGMTCTHLIEDGWLLRTVDWRMSALPTDAPRLRRLAADIHSAPVDEDDDAVSAASGRPTTREDPHEPAIVMRWLTQARSRIEIERVPSRDLAAP